MNRRFPHTMLRRGTTLIEVLAGLVILSTLLVSVAIARGRFLRQWADADQRLAAVNEIDHLLEQWLAGPPQAVPISWHGVTEDARHHFWQTRILPSTAVQPVGLIVVRLQLFEHSASTIPLAKVDFLLQDPRRVATPPAGGAR